MSWTRRHLLTVEELSLAEIDQIHAAATAFNFAMLAITDSSG